MANKKVKNIINMRSTVRTLSIKCYAEQIPEGEEQLKAAIKAISKDKWQVLAICHNRDYAGDDFWAPSLEKPHYHIIVRVLGGKPVRVEQILKALGVIYREVVDKNLWENHGVETCRDFGGMAVYLTHETEQAILDGKEKYEIEEIISNLGLEEIRQIREGYVRVSDSGEKVTPRVLAELDAQAFELGRNFGDFDKWYGALGFEIRSQAKMRTIRESYERGINERLEGDETVARLCVFIESPHGMGKTTAAHYALRKLGRRYLDIGGGGSGKFDNLKVTHGAIVVDDDACPNVLNMADTRYCRAYRRNKNNPPWVGDYLIVTSNLSFEDWLWEKCGICNAATVAAAKSRFYICHLYRPNELDRDVLYCTDRAERGGGEFLAEMDRKYIEFKEYFNEYLADFARTKDDRERVEINAVTIRRDETAACARLEEQMERARQAEAQYEEQIAAEFAESVEHPDDFLEGIMMRWWMTPIGEEKEKEEEELGRAIFV